MTGGELDREGAKKRMKDELEDSTQETENSVAHGLIYSVFYFFCLLSSNFHSSFILSTDALAGARASALRLLDRHGLR